MRDIGIPARDETIHCLLWSILIHNFPLPITSYQLLKPQIPTTESQREKSASHINVSTSYHSYLNTESGKKICLDPLMKKVALIHTACTFFPWATAVTEC